MRGEVTVRSGFGEPEAGFEAVHCLFVLRDVIETLKESSWFGNEGAMDYGDSDGDGGGL